MSRPAMTFAPPQRRLYATLRRVLASLLVCLMLPGSIADASSFVWCFSDSGHFAIEACTGPVCHGDQLDRAKGQFGEQAERARLIEQHHADCVDVKLLPTAALASARSANFVGEILDFDEAVPPHHTLQRFLIQPPVLVPGRQSIVGGRIQSFCFGALPFFESDTPHS